jgi:hypothetical protein
MGEIFEWCRVFCPENERVSGLPRDWKDLIKFRLEFAGPTAD